jgi:hypothetical protein
MAAYTRDDVEKMAEALRSLPAATKNKLSKQGVVSHLAAEILGLQERGYTIEQVAESLRSLGLVITNKTLSTYLGRLKKNPPPRAEGLAALGSPPAHRKGAGPGSGRPPSVTTGQLMDDELERFKRDVNLTELAASRGYRLVDRERSG